MLRKDQMLQENGYLVLRFLAEDVGKELDAVLDAILRSLSNRAGRARAPVQMSDRTHSRKTTFEHREDVAELELARQLRSLGKGN